MAPLERQQSHTFVPPIVAVSPRSVFEFDREVEDDRFAVVDFSSDTLQRDEQIVKVIRNHDNDVPAVVPLRKQVRFNDSVNVFWIPGKKCYTDEHKSLIWYKKKDYNRFKESCRRIVEWVDNIQEFSFVGCSNTKDDSNFCSRGLERYTREGNIRFIERTTAKMNDLFVLRMTRATPQELADLMTMHSSPFVLEALERGKKDAKLATRCHREGKKISSSTSSGGRKVTPPPPSSSLKSTSSPSSSSSSAFAFQKWPNMMPKVRAIWDQRDEFLSTKGLASSIDRESLRSVRYL